MPSQFTIQPAEGAPSRVSALTPSQCMPGLLIISSATAHVDGDDVVLDIKFVEGMRLYSDLWPGEVACLLVIGAQMPFSRRYNSQDLPFKLSLIDAGDLINKNYIADHGIILCSGDDPQYLNIKKICDSAGSLLVYNIEYTLHARLNIININQAVGYFQKSLSAMHAIFAELKRRRAFSRSDGLQVNGYPAFASYGKIAKSSVLYLDSRLRKRLVIAEADLERRIDRVLCGDTLRLVHSGRLEPMKGSGDLIELALALRAQDIDFTLDIFGCGSLEDQIIRDVNRHDLQSVVRIRHKVDFEEELVPFLRDNCDIYISCHRQSDPSCTYLENMGLGLAVIGYDNLMWSHLCRESGAGWAVPLGDANALAGAVAAADRNRTELADCMRAARRFSDEHCFETEFAKRVRHLKSLVKARRADKQSQIKVREK